MAAHPSRPTHAQLINRYLFPKIIGQLNDGSCPSIKEANVYSRPPHQLAAEHPGTGHGEEGSVRYFFSRLHYTSENQKRRLRMVGDDGTGRWHPETGKQKVEGTAGGCLKKFSYMFRTPSGGWERSGWVMAEYSYGSDDTVLCKVYKPRPAAGSSEEPTARTRSRQQTATSSSRHYSTALLGDGAPRFARGAEGYNQLILQREPDEEAESSGRAPPPEQQKLMEMEDFLLNDDVVPLQIPYDESLICSYENYLLSPSGV